MFSEVVLLKGESRSEYERLLRGLRKAAKPEGAAEDLLVEKLATISWRQRRLLSAECAEIRKGQEFVELDLLHQIEEETEIIATSAIAGALPLIRQIQNPRVAERCLDFLELLREQINARGFSPDAGPAT